MNLSGNFGYLGKFFSCTSNKIFSGWNEVPPAIRYNLLLCWGNPKYLASRTRHATLREGPYIIPAFDHFFFGIIFLNPDKDETKQPNALVLSDKTPSTFSQKTIVLLSLLSFLILSLDSISTNFNVKLPLSSIKPFFRPARENAWHGVPPQIKSGVDSDLFIIFYGMSFISPIFTL